MRIAIEYQYTDRNYSRFVTYAGITHENKKWSFGSYLYSENDIKNNLYSKIFLLNKLKFWQMQEITPL
jgi:hypothetical protein